MSTFSLQDALNRAVLGIVAQGALARGEERCEYYTTLGHRCAIGHVISEQEAKDWERTGVTDVSSAITNNMMPGVLIGTPESSFLCDLQVIHDTAKDVAAFVRCAKNLAHRNKLEFPDVE